MRVRIVVLGVYLRCLRYVRTYMFERIRVCVPPYQGERSRKKAYQKERRECQPSVLGIEQCVSNVGFLYKLAMKLLVLGKGMRRMFGIDVGTEVQENTVGPNWEMSREKRQKQLRSKY